MHLQEAGNLQGALVLLADAQMQRFHTAQQQVSRHRVERCARDLAVVVDALDQRLRATDDAAQRIRVAAEELGRAVQH